METEKPTLDTTVVATTIVNNTTSASGESTDENDDSEIVKKDEAIALAEKEEESLAKAIRETESEMPPDDLESSSEDASKLLTPSKVNKMFDGLYQKYLKMVFLLLFYFSIIG